MNVLDLFSGIGGFSLGLERAGMDTVAFCEIDEFCRKVLDKNYPFTPIFKDVREINREVLDAAGIGKIDVICGGFPCQPFSNAGKKKGRDDDRDLWPEMFRIINEIKPTWVIGENVTGFLTMEFTRSKINLESIGYSVQPFIIPACAVGAQHRRDRVWIIAHLDRSKLRQQSNEFPECKSEGFAGHNGQKESTTDIDCERVEGFGKSVGDESKHSDLCSSISSKSTSDLDSDGLSGEANASKKKNSRRNWEGDWRTNGSFNFGNWWADQPRVGRAVYGFSRELDKNRRFRIKALGNTVIPLIPEIIGRAIMEIQSRTENCKTDLKVNIKEEDL